MLTKLKSINRADGYVWLAVEFGPAEKRKTLFLHPQARIGDLMRSGQRAI